MRSSVKAAWPAFITVYEGHTTWMYLDTRKLVTFGIGQLGTAAGAPNELLITRPWRNKLGRLVTENLILREFNRIATRVDLAPKGGNAFQPIAALSLSNADVDEALLQTTDDFWDVLHSRLPDLERWPADAQLAIMNMAWLNGPYLLDHGWPNFAAAAKAGDFLGCAAHCQSARRSTRDATNVRLFTNAARVAFARLDPNMLWMLGVPQLLIKRPAILEVSAVKAQWALDNPTMIATNGHYLQIMLGDLGLYKGPLDGLCGANTAAALKVFCATRSGLTYGVTVPVITALSNASTGMPVVA